MRLLGPSLRWGDIFRVSKALTNRNTAVNFCHLKYMCLYCTGQWSKISQQALLDPQAADTAVFDVQIVIETIF